MHQFVIYLHEDQLIRLREMAYEKGRTVPEEFDELRESVLGVIAKHLEVRQDIRFLGQYTDVTVPANIVTEIHDLAPHLNKIQMIKHCREKCGFGLKDAKFVVDVIVGQETNLA